MLFLDANGLVNITISDVLTLGASCVTIFITVWASNRIMRHKMRTENEKKFGKKADKDYVDRQDIGLHKRVDELRDANNKLDEKIKIMSENVAWIRGFLDPNKK